MTLAIEQVRPQVVSVSFAQNLQELLKFRHVFRNLYKISLNPLKVNYVQQSTHGLWDEFEGYHEQFIEFVRELGKRVEDL